MSDSIERMWRRVLLTIGIGRITAVESDAGPTQKLQVRLGAMEIKGDTSRLAEYGFQSVPPVGSDVVMVFVAGERSNGVVIACGNQTFRMKGMADGEVAISDNKGQSVYLSAAGIRIDGGGLPIEISNTPRVTMDTRLLSVTGAIVSGADITAEGEVSDQGGGKSMARMRATYDAHKHGTSALPAPQM